MLTTTFRAHHPLAAAGARALSTIMVVCCSLIAQQSLAKTSLPITVDIHHGISNTPAYFDDVTGSMSSSETQKQLYPELAEKTGDQLALSITKDAHPSIDKMIDTCEFDKPENYSNIDEINVTAHQFFNCYKHQTENKAQQIAEQLKQSGQFAYALPLVFWGTEWTPPGELNWSEPLTNWYVTQVLLVTKDGKYYQSTPLQQAYAQGYGRESDQRDPTSSLFPEVADQLATQIKQTLAEVN